MEETTNTTTTRRFKNAAKLAGSVIFFGILIWLCACVYLLGGGIFGGIK
jgi:hypothetical protein